MYKKGIFWFKDLDNLENNKDYIFIIDCDENGTPFSTVGLNSKKKRSYNHRKTWENMDSKLKDNKSFTYYPRGRVEIRNLEVAVYINPNLLRDDVKEFINKTFELSNPSINKVNYICQYSDHYKCHLDSGYKG